MDSFYADAAGGRSWVDHSPVYARMLPRLAGLLPRARVVFVNRDGREVVAELRRRIPGLDHESACRIWARYAAAWRRSGSSGLDVLEVRSSWPAGSATSRS